MASRACLFCSRTPVTAEHVIPEWLAKHLGVVRLEVNDRRRNAKRESVGGFGLTTRWFCEDCNGRWMGRIETRVQPWLKPLSLGLPASVSQLGQTALSAWAWKTSLTTSATAPSRRTGFDLDEFRRFRRTGVPPDSGAYVWMGGFKRMDRQASLAELETKLEANGTHASSIHVFTISVGSVWLQTLRHRHLNDRLQLVVTPDDADAFCVRIWPVAMKPVRPPIRAISQERFHEVAERWQRAGWRH